jgi:peptide deformylase
MYDANGIGLAAPQVGRLIQMLVIDTRPRDPDSSRYDNDDQTELEKKIKQPLVLINPEIVKGEGKTTFDEGCLSVPSYVLKKLRLKPTMSTVRSSAWSSTVCWRFVFSTKWTIWPVRYSSTI